MKRAALLAIALASRTARADGDDPRVLFAAGRFAAAAEVFEHRWAAKGDAIDGVNAVVSWRTAGRYARASALLAKVRASRTPPAGDAATTAADLDDRLATLTATATIEGPLSADAAVRVDADPPERIGEAIIFDVGEHDIVIEQPGCDRFVWHVVAYPGARVAVPFRPHCDRMGTLHVYLAGDPGAGFAVDGVPHVAGDHEADVKLEPGPHVVHVEARSRPVLDESIAIRDHETTALRIRYPWRARRIGVIIGVTTAVRAGQEMSGAGLALTVGIWGARFRYTFDGGTMLSNTHYLDPSTGTPGRPWIADTAAYHVFARPLWHGKLGPYRLALDADPIAVRFDEVRAVSYFGIRNGCDNIEARVRAWSFAPVALSADGPYVHTEITLWPVSYVSYHPPSMDCATELPAATGWGAFVTITGGWRL